MRVRAYLLVFSLVVFCIVFPGGISKGSSGNKTPDWHDEFEEICSMVQAGDTLSKEELKDLIKRAEKLMEEIRGLKLPSKKVYLFRLKKCRKFFEYILEMKEAEKTSLLRSPFPPSAS